MGAIETKVGNFVQRLLMPTEAPAHYAVGRSTEFPEAPPNSLLFLASISLETPDLAAANKFYVDGLGFGRLAQDEAGKLSLYAGVVQLLLHLSRSSPDRTDQRFAQAWPGHIYFWVRDSRATFDACSALRESLGAHIIDEVHSNSNENAIDTLVLVDPQKQNRFVVNPAAKGGLVDRIQSLGCAAGGQATNAIAILDATHLVAPGAGVAISRFYESFLGAAMTQRRGGYVLHFSLGSALQQSLTFVEDPSVLPLNQDDVGKSEVPGVCVYMPSMDSFCRAFKMCADAGILHGVVSSMIEAQRTSEFCFRSCVDPRSKQVVLELLHFVRVREHPECHLPVGQVWRQEAKHTPNEQLSNSTVSAMV